MAAKVLLASGNPGKWHEYRTLWEESRSAGSFELGLLDGFRNIREFPEDAPTFAEIALGKALYYSRFSEEFVFADDSGLVVDALAGRPGVHSARYAGPGAASEALIAKLSEELRRAGAADRSAHFVCAIALARQGRAHAVVTARADGRILPEARGSAGFGYDPVFLFPPLGKTFAEMTGAEKNRHSHRGKAFRRLLTAIEEQLRP